MIKKTNFKTWRISLMVVFFAFLVHGCGSDLTSPEQQIRDALYAIELATEERSMSDFMNGIADDYSDHQGNDNKAIRRIIQLLFVRNQSINIFTIIHSIDISDNIAAVELSVAMASRDVDLEQESNRLKADTQRFSIVLTQSNDTWLIQSGSWKDGWDSDY